MLKHEKVTEMVIGCAYRVHNRMGYGFLESVYERCMAVELGKMGLKAESQRPITVYYEGQNVGEFVADLVVDGTIIIELKSVTRLVKAHEVQFVNYLTATRTDVGLLLNFGPEKVEVKRKFRLPRSQPDF